MTSLNSAYRSLLGRFVLPKNSLADQFWPRVKAGVLAASVLAAFGAAEASAADPVDQRRVGAGWNDPALPDVKLNFYAKSWAEVFESLAEQSGSQLVMDSAPSGRFSRRDSRKYTRTEAVRIVNRDLEEEGFRLIEKGNFLVVLQLNDVRMRYRRPVVSAHDIGEQKTPVGEVELSAGPGEAMSSLRQSTSPGRFESFSPNSRSAEVIEAAAVEKPAASTAVQPAVSQVSKRTEEAAESRLQRRISLENRGAVDVARMIYAAMKPSAELIDNGPDNLPAFRVRSTDAAGKEISLAGFDYVIGIDEQADELVVEAPRQRVGQIENLVAQLDRRPGPAGSELRYVPSDGDVKKLADSVRPVLRTLVAQRDEEETPMPRAGEFPAPPRAGEFADQSDEEMAEPETEVTIDNADEAETPLKLDLKGTVNIQDVPGVGLVISGNRDDVNEVERVIRALELASQGQTPGVHLQMLQHVNSEALADLLNSVYEQLGEVGLGGVEGADSSVQVLATSKPNAVLVLAPVGELEAVKLLIQQLDQPVDPAAEFEVFHLAYAVAGQVVTTLETFFDERPALGTRVRAVADVRTNSVIVHARGRDLEEIRQLVIKLDQSKSAAVSRLRIFPLKNAEAEQLAQVINTAIQSVINPPTPPTTSSGQNVQGFGGGGAGTTGQVAPELQEAKSAVLEFLASDGEARTLIRSGILADIRVTADPARNALLISASTESMTMMEALVKHLDQPTALVSEIKVFTLANSDALATADLLRTLFESEGQTNEGNGLQLAGAEGAGASMIPLRFSVDARTNSILATGSGDALQIVEAILLRLDESDVRERESIVVKLKNSPAADVALAVNEFLTAQRDLAQIDPELVTNLEIMEREIIVVPETVSNSLLISATPRYFEEILTLVHRLDEKPPEVVIQALLVEVELDNDDEFGVQLGLQDSVLFDRSIDNTPGYNFNNQPLGRDTTANPSAIGTQALSDFALGRLNNSLGFGGLVLAASSESVSVLIRALSAKRNVQILSRPTIRTLDNQLAQILVGQQVPVVDGVTITGSIGIATPQIVQQQVGIILAVTPRISPDGSIVMETVATKSSLSSEGVPIFTDIETGSVIESPIINLTTAQATVSVPNGQTVVLGGMITKDEVNFRRNVPWIGDLPILGIPFRYEGKSTRRTELLIFLTPRVIYNDIDSEVIKRVETERLHFLEKEAEAIHGPLYSAPQAQQMLPYGMPGMSIEGEFSEGEFMEFDQSNVPTTIMNPHDYEVMPLPEPTMEIQEQELRPAPPSTSKRKVEPFPLPLQFPNPSPRPVLTRKAAKLDAAKKGEE